MKRIILFYVILFVYINQPVFPQENLGQNTLKYWHYRDRLKYFVVPGTNQGESEIVCLRNRGDIDATWSNINFGQHSINFGYYIGVLATEYRLLTDNGHTVDASVTRNEVNLALQQFNNRMDKTAFYGDDSITENGFFIRENVPCDFVDNSDPAGNPLGKAHYDLLNQGLDPVKNAWDDVNKTFTGLPNGHPGPINSVSECGNINHMSQDEAIGLLMGLALIHKCMPLTPEDTAAGLIAFRIIDYIHNSGSVHYWIYTPAGASIPVIKGGFAVLFGMGFAKAGTYFGWDFTTFTDPFTLSTVSSLAWQVQQYDVPRTDIKAHAMACTLAAIGDSWREAHIPSTGDGIDRVTDQYEINTFYLLLWAYLHDKNAHNNNLNKSRALAISQLNDAPYEGPYYFTSRINSGKPNGWGYNYKWRGEIWEQYGCDSNDHDSRSKGVYNGLDFMLLFNLYHLFYSAPMADYHYNK